MTEENPWKKQLQMQKNNVESTSGNSGQTLVSTPPWIKKKEDDTGNSSPPWMKKKEEDTSNSSPPWMKKKEEDAPSTAPWMKKQ